MASARNISMHLVLAMACAMPVAGSAVGGFASHEDAVPLGQLSGPSLVSTSIEPSHAALLGDGGQVLGEALRPNRPTPRNIESAASRMTSSQDGAVELSRATTHVPVRSSSQAQSIRVLICSWLT